MNEMATDSYLVFLFSSFSGTKNGKRVQANLGAKNHGVIMADGKLR